MAWNESGVEATEAKSFVFWGSNIELTATTYMFYSTNRRLFSDCLTVTQIWQPSSSLFKAYSSIFH